MAATLLVRRSTARLLCLVRSQVASLWTERTPPPDSIMTTDGLVVSVIPSDPVARPAHEAYSGLKQIKQIWKKYNLWKDKRPPNKFLDEVKEWQNFYHPTQRDMARAHLCYYRGKVRDFGGHILTILFMEHLVKHCSHRKIQMEKAWKFQNAFNLPTIEFLAGQAELYYQKTAVYRNRKLPQVYKEILLREVEESKEKLRDSHRGIISDEVMREIEEDCVKEINQEFVGKRNPGMASPSARWSAWTTI